MYPNIHWFETHINFQGISRTNIYPCIRIYPGFWDTIYFSKYGSTLSSIYPCIQISSYLRHTYIFRIYQELTHIHLSTYIQDSETHIIFQSKALLSQHCIHVSKYPNIQQFETCIHFQDISSININPFIHIYPGFWDTFYFLKYGITLSTNYPCIQISSDLRHTYIFRVYQERTYIHISAYIQDSETHFIFQSMALLCQQIIHVSKHPAIWDIHIFSGWIKD